VRSSGATREQLQGAAGLIMRRQAVFQRDHPPALWAVIDQRALLDPPLADKDAHLEQIDALIAAVKTPRVSIQITRSPAETGHVIDSPRFTVLRFPEPSCPDLLQFHLLHCPFLIEDRCIVEDYLRAFTRLCAQVCQPADTADILDQIRSVIVAEGTSPKTRRYFRPGS
jgi:hypothetical protein